MKKERKTTAIYVKLTSQEKQLLKEKSEAKNITMTKLIIDSVEKF